MAINPVSTQVVQTTAADATNASSTAKTSSTSKKDDTADFISRAKKLILNPKSSTDDIMTFLQKEASGGELTQEKQLVLQELFQARHETSDLLSNVFRMLSDAAMNVIRNIH